MPDENAAQYEDLVRRVASSSAFEKAPRLRAFFLHVCRCALDNKPEAATEQQIGIHVYDRPAGYNPNEDNIVRSQARLLRMKLDHHFATEGKDEAVVITIPKGRYLPVFTPRSEEPPAPPVAPEPPRSNRVTIDSGKSPISRARTLKLRRGTVDHHRLSRRHFFYGTLLAGAVPRGGFGSTPSLSRLGYKSPNEKLNIGAVGMGIRGPAIVFGAAETENIVAVCDVDEERSARGFAQYPNAKKYKDYRKMFDAEKSIDAVMIATPDHMHTPVALLAMQQGKHVYCEKPLVRTPWEAQLLVDAAAKYKVATQMGNQGWSHEGSKTACEILWSGEIGEVKELHAWTGGIYGGQPKLPATGPETEPVPAGLDWDLWLGCAEPRGFNLLMTKQWRAFLDFSTGGSLGDWLVHNLGPAHLALQLGETSPASVECVFVEGKSQWLWPLRAHLVFEFPARGAMPPVTVHAYQNMRGDFQDPPGMAEGERLFPPMNNLAEKGRPFPQTGDGTMLLSSQLTVDGQPIGRQGRPGGPPPGRGPSGPPDTMRAPGNGAVFVGSKGYMATCTRGEGVWLLPASRWAEYKLPSQMLPRGVNHQQDWIRACKGGAPGVSEFGVAARYIEWLAMGAIALRVPGKLLWDAKKRRFTNSEEANRLVRPFVRKGWEMKL